MKGQITYFEDKRADNTDETFRLVEKRLENPGIKKIVLASTTGPVARRAMEFFSGKDVKLIVVPHQYDFSAPANRFPADLVSELRSSGHEVHFGTMLFHTDKLFGTDVPTIVANFLRCFSQGVKVCYEIVLMAADAGYLDLGEKVIAIAGTGRGADTALVMQASSTRNLGKLKINEILCKPLNLIEDA